MWHQVSGGSRGRVWLGPPLFLDQTEARRTDKTFFWRLGPPPPYLRVWMTVPSPFIWRSGSASAGYHGGKISGTQQSFLTETAICTVKRWKKFTGYRLVPECNNCAQVSHTCPFFFPARPGLVEIQTYHGNVMKQCLLYIGLEFSLIISVEPHPGDVQGVMGSWTT